MADRLETAEDFKINLREVDLLLREAGSVDGDEDKLAAFNKSAVLLLMGKFEAFLESSVEDYVYAVSSLGAMGSHLPLRMLVQHSVESVRGLEERMNQGDIERIENAFIGLGQLWTDVVPCNGLSIASSFNYGKHGETEVAKLLKRVGIDEVFSIIKISNESEDYLDNKPKHVDLAGLFNSLISIRNNILHQDASPSLTTTTIQKHRNILSRFADALVAHLQTSLDEIELSTRTNGRADGGS